jgi:hypothetical protein
MGKRIKSENKGGGEESKFIEEYTPLQECLNLNIKYGSDICNQFDDFDQRLFPSWC